MDPPQNEEAGELELPGFDDPSATTRQVPDSITPDDPGQSVFPTLLVGKWHDTRDWLRACPSAQSITAYSQARDLWLLIQLRCRRWSCRICGERKIAHYARKVQHALPNRFITLTCNPRRWSDPRAAYDGTRRAVTALSAKLRRRLGEWEYFKVLEATKKGWPHYHLIVRSPYVHQPLLSQMWNDLTGAPIVDVRQLKKIGDVYTYVVKYLGKQQYIPWTDRRASWTRNFWIDDGFKPGDTLNLAQVDRHSDHPATWLTYNYAGRSIERLSPDVWILRGDPPPREPGDE